MSVTLYTRPSFTRWKSHSYWRRLEPNLETTKWDIETFSYNLTRRLVFKTSGVATLQALQQKQVWAVATLASFFRPGTFTFCCPIMHKKKNYDGLLRMSSGVLQSKERSCSVVFVALQQTLLYLVPDGRRVNKPRLGGWESQQPFSVCNLS